MMLQRPWENRISFLRLGCSKSVISVPDLRVITWIYRTKVGKVKYYAEYSEVYLVPSLTWMLWLPSLGTWDRIHF
jgi:hypothetical protein